MESNIINHSSRQMRDGFSHWHRGVSVLFETKPLRATELSSASGVPDKFAVVHSVRALNSKVTEEKVHHRLEDRRYNQKREFFEVDVKQAIEIVDEVVEDVNSRVAA